MVSKLKFLVKGYHRKVGRNNIGRISSYHRGGGVKRKYRFFDLNSNFSFFDNKSFYYRFGRVISFVYDPFRNVLLSLVKWFFSEPFLFFFDSYSFMLKVEGAFLNKPIFFSSEKLNFLDLNYATGSSLKLIDILPGIYISNVGGKYARAGFCSAFIITKKYQSNKVLLQLPSKQRIWLVGSLFGTVGVPSLRFFSKKHMGKAGRTRWLGFRPIVRGVAMNPIDHPHGGGEGKTSGGRPSVSPWGKLTIKNKNKG